MANRDLNWYRDKSEEMVQNDTDRNKLFANIDKIVEAEWTLPDKDDTIREIVDTTGIDALNAGATALSSLTPRLTVLPPQTKNDYEIERLNRLEQCLSWNFGRSDRRGDGSVMYDLALSSLTYGMQVAHVDDLAWLLPSDHSKWSKGQRRAWRRGRFLVTPYHPAGVHTDGSDDGALLHVENFKIKTLMQYWELSKDHEDYGPMITAALAELKAIYDDDPNAYVMQFYYRDDDRIVVRARQAESEEREDSNLSGDITILDKENKLPFSPWAIRMGGSRLKASSQWRVNPMLATLAISGSWENINMANTLVFSEMFKRISGPRDVAYLEDPNKPLNVDYKNGATVKLNSREKFERLTPPLIDENAIAFIRKLEATIDRNTGVSMLGNVNASANTPFATYQAQLQVALSKLDVHLKMGEFQVGDITTIYCYWADYDKTPLEAYTSGGALAIHPKEIDLDKLFILVKIKPKTPTDYQQQILAAVQGITHLGLSKRQAWEDLGRDNPDMILEEGYQEKLNDSELQNYLAEQSAKVQAMIQIETARAMGELQAEQAQKSQEAAAAAQNQGGAPAGGQPGMNQANQAALTPANGLANAAFGMTQGLEGYNSGAGGISPAQANPTTTRETLNPPQRAA